MLYRKFIWPMILLIIVIGTTLAIVSVQTKTESLSPPERNGAARKADPAKFSEGSVWGSRASSAASLLPQDTSETNQLLAAPQGRNIVRIDTEQLTYRSFGFETAEIRRPPGRFLLVIHNRSGIRQLTLMLSSENGRLVREVRIGPNRLNWHEVVDLPVGQYVLSNPERGHRCAVIIEGK